MAKSKKWPSAYTRGEARTVTGQLVEFDCSNGKIEEISAFLAEHILQIYIPTTRQVSVSHGGYGRYTRYNITQHKYAGGGYGSCGGYIEVLEIKNPPEGRCGIVTHEWLGSSGSTFAEWETLQNALAAFKKHWSIKEKEFKELPGFKRIVSCGALCPWFYAVGDEELVGDYAFPDGLQDDPVFRFGNKFVVFNHDGLPSIKTCMGTRFVEKEREYYPHEKYTYRIVYWEDGTVWNESHYSSKAPRPAEEGELWITNAILQFRKLLTGQTDRFEVKFVDGQKFVGKLVTSKNMAQSPEGDYLVAVTFKSDHKPMEGWVHGFKPTTKCPNIIQYVTDRLAEEKRVACIKIKQRRTAKGGNKWSGVFFQK